MMRCGEVVNVLYVHVDREVICLSFSMLLVCCVAV